MKPASPSHPLPLSIRTACLPYWVRLLPEARRWAASQAKQASEQSQASHASSLAQTWVLSGDSLPRHAHGPPAYDASCGASFSRTCGGCGCRGDDIWPTRRHGDPGMCWDVLGGVLVSGVILGVGYWSVLSVASQRCMYVAAHQLPVTRAAITRMQPCTTRREAITTVPSGMPAYSCSKSPPGSRGLLVSLG